MAAQHTNKRYCKVSFPTDDDMGKAFEELIYNSDHGFTGLSEDSIIINRVQCNQLENLQSKGTLSFNHLD